MKSKTLVHRRSENILSVKSDPKLAFLPADFEPRKVPGVEGLYVSKAKVVPNVFGEIYISVLNVTEKDIELFPRTRIGRLTEPSEIIRWIDEMEPTDVGVVDKIIVADSLELEQKKEVESLLKEYADIFASNPKKPKRVNTLQHQIITDESQPVFNKPRKIPNAWQTEVEKQIGEMAENDIIRPFSSPWNSPILLVKKKDGSTRFVCDFRGLNDITKKDRYPLPNISDMLDKILEGGGVRPK